MSNIHYLIEKIKSGDGSGKSVRSLLLKAYANLGMAKGYMLKAVDRNQTLASIEDSLYHVERDLNRSLQYVKMCRREMKKMV